MGLLKALIDKVFVVIPISIVVGIIIYITYDRCIPKNTIGLLFSVLVGIALVAGNTIMLTKKGKL